MANANGNAISAEPSARSSGVQSAGSSTSEKGSSGASGAPGRHLLEYWGFNLSLDRSGLSLAGSFFSVNLAFCNAATLVANSLPI